MTQFIPAWQDKATLAKNLCLCPRTIDTWVRVGLLPPPRYLGGKTMWKWIEVEAYLDRGGSDAPPSADPYNPEVIRASTEKALRAHRR